MDKKDQKWKSVVSSSCHVFIRPIALTVIIRIFPRGLCIRWLVRFDCNKPALCGESSIKLYFQSSIQTQNIRQNLILDSWNNDDKTIKQIYKINIFIIIIIVDSFIEFVREGKDDACLIDESSVYQRSPDAIINHT